MSRIKDDDDFDDFNNIYKDGRLGKLIVKLRRRNHSLVRKIEQGMSCGPGPLHFRVIIGEYDLAAWDSPPTTSDLPSSDRESSEFCRTLAGLLTRHRDGHQKEWGFSCTFDTTTFHATVQETTGVFMPGFTPGNVVNLPREIATSWPLNNWREC